MEEFEKILMRILAVMLLGLILFILISVINTQIEIKGSKPAKQFLIDYPNYKIQINDNKILDKYCDQRYFDNHGSGDIIRLYENDNVKSEIILSKKFQIFNNTDVWIKGRS